MWLLAFATALTVALVAQGTVVIEYVERTVWRSMLAVELDHFIQRSREDPVRHWNGTAGVVVYAGADNPDLPPELRGLEEGLHDDLPVGGANHVVLVRDDAGTRYTLALDIDQFSSDESGFEWLTPTAAATLTASSSSTAAAMVSHSKPDSSLENWSMSKASV